MTDFEIIKRSRLSGPGLRAFCKIADLWDMNEGQKIVALGDPDRATYCEWMMRAQTGEALTLSQDTLMRISAVLGIHKALKYLFSDHAQALAWLNSPHRGTAFQCTSPLHLVVHGEQDGMMAVRRYLEGWCGGQAGQGASECDFTPVTEDDVVFF